MDDYVGVHVELQEPGLIGHLELAIFRSVLQVNVGIYLIRQFLRHNLSSLLSYIVLGC